MQLYIVSTLTTAQFGFACVHLMSSEDWDPATCGALDNSLAGGPTRWSVDSDSHTLRAPDLVSAGDQELAGLALQVLHFQKVETPNAWTVFQKHFANFIISKCQYCLKLV